MTPDISEEVRQFVAKYIQSLDQVEVLLLVSALPDRAWSADAVYKVVLSNPALVVERLENFVAAGLLRRSGDPPVFSYAPPTVEVANQVAALSAIYKTSRHKIVEFIYRPRPDPMKSFSDAFKLKPEK